MLTDSNVELVATLLADLRGGLPHATPGVVVLPPGAVDDAGRWLRTWPELGPRDAWQWLGLEPDAGWEIAVEAAYARFADHWAAGVAFHR